LGFEHNSMALEVSSVLLGQLRADNAKDWTTPRLTEKCILWQGIADWPRPDITFEDPTSGATIALEFKPPNQSKREYVTGIGQMITYLSDFEFAGLVLPRKSSDGFPIAEHIADVIASELANLPIALFSYDKSVTDLKVERGLVARVGPAPARKARRGRGTFWAYWRDLSQYDLFELLRIIDAGKAVGFDKSFRKFWTRFIVPGKARTWEGVARKKAPKAKITPEQRNAFYAMRHCGLIDNDGRITLAGLELLQVGKVYGPASVAFVTLLANRVLVDGRHLDLILWMEKQSASLAQKSKKTSDRYLSALDKTLVDEGIIPPRTKGASKAHFIRDEPKLWNKLGLLNKKNDVQYFHPDIGYQFDWRRIISSIETEV
jgi:hypothetical protein